MPFLKIEQVKSKCIHNQSSLKISLAASIYMSAMLVGSFTYGILSDRIGRRCTAVIAQLNVASGLLLTAFMPNYISFSMSRFITGFGG